MYSHISSCSNVVPFKIQRKDAPTMSEEFEPWTSLLKQIVSTDPGVQHSGSTNSWLYPCSGAMTLRWLCLWQKDKWLCRGITGNVAAAAAFTAATTAAAPKEMFLQMFLTHVHNVPAPHLATEFSVADNVATWHSHHLNLAFPTSLRAKVTWS